MMIYGNVVGRHKSKHCVGMDGLRPDRPWGHHRFLSACLSHLISVLLLHSVYTFNIEVNQPILYAGQTNDSYFGFSVLQHSNSAGKWVLVGAPLSNSDYQPTLDRPGALYKCSVVEPHQCEQVKIDDKGNEFRGLGQFKPFRDQKDGQWLGVALTRQPTTDAAWIAVCGHRWANVYYGNEVLPNGVCYVVNSELEFDKVQKIRPCLEEDQIIEDVAWQGWCQAGMSATFSEDNSILTTGTVGSIAWQGAVAAYILQTGELPTGGGAQDGGGGDGGSPQIDPSTPIVRVANVSPWFTNRTTQKEHYVGYSVGSGHFFEVGSTEGVAGAPRAFSTGRVYIYNLGDFSQLVELEGTQICSYFGAAVGVADFNNDGLSDLVVGAPLYATRVEEGRAYVYINHGQGEMVASEMPLSGRDAYRARFGTAIAPAGDLDQDGFTDVAIGAPYEDEMVGAVYIYHGSNQGISPQDYQRISGSLWSARISSFGHALAGGLDMDGNGYPDIVVGSYEASAATLLKSKAVVRVVASLELSTEMINTNVTECLADNQPVSCFQVDACFLYDGVQVPAAITLEYRLQTESGLETESLSPRVYFETSQGTKINDSITPSAQEKKCTSHTVIVKDNIRDFLMPVLFELTYQMISQSDEFPVPCLPAPCPEAILSQKQPTTVFGQANFVHDCGPDNECVTDLRLLGSIITAEGYDDYLPLGRVPYISVMVTVENPAEDAHQTTVRLYYPTELNYIGVDDLNRDTLTSCAAGGVDLETGKAYLTCLAGNPLKANQKSEFRLRLDVTQLGGESDNLTLSMEVTTTSTEYNTTLQNNRVTLTVPVKIEADISITGESIPDYVEYGEETKEEWTDYELSLLEDYPIYCENIGPRVTHRYTVSNLGPSDLPLKSTVEFQWPLKTSDGDFLLYLIMPVVRDGGGSCQAYSILDAQHLEMTKLCDETQALEDSIVDDSVVVEDSSSTHFNVTDSTTVKTTTENSQKLVTHNCSSGECVRFYCYLDSPLEDGESVIIEVYSRLWRRTLAKHAELDRVDLISEATVEVEDSMDRHRQPLAEDQPDSTKVVTKAVVELMAGSGVAIWIIIVSIIAGIAALVIIVIIMWKAGFFRRQKKEDLKKLIEVDGGGNTEENI